MKRVLCGLLLFSTLIIAQGKKDQNHSLQNINCKTCHTCDVPTKQNPCLVACPRDQMVTVKQPAEKGPDVIIIDKLAKKYLPATFSHKVHAQMSQMSGGCSGCHHYNTSGPVLACSDCHDVNRKREDVSKPDLQAAYHRLCINCHKEWSHATDCNACHLTKGSTLTKKEPVTGKNHPEVIAPEKLVYETNYGKGKIVTFSHKDHTNLFGASCVNCHQKESCNRCHDTKNPTVVSSNMPFKISKSGSQHHQPCFKCHADDGCGKCHLDKEKGSFDHKTSAGWALNRFHEKLECAKCHGTNNKFAKLDNRCTSCHKDFAAGKFNHSKTGLKLDETHAELECSDCHTDNNFTNKPDCSNCHDDKAYPKDKPGTMVKLTKK